MKEGLPTILTIFGATGNLSKTKLFPAIFDLYKEGLLPDKFIIVGFSRSDMSDNDFRKLIKEEANPNNINIDKLINNLFYVSGDMKEDVSYGKLADKVVEIEENLGICADKLYYLAVPPSLFSTSLDKLAHSGLTIPCGGDDGWSRILIEKPFGSNAEEALEINKKLVLLFDESQVFKIDHYLTKEVLQNIVTFRFSNSIFEPVWSNKYLEGIEVMLLEKGDIGSRGGFYDGLGALRDVGQNHLLQMLALVVMEKPDSFSSDNIRKNRARAISNLDALTVKEVKSNVIKGQYKGYKEIQGVNPKSNTETYFKITTKLSGGDLDGVPVILESGKALNINEVSVKLSFKANDSKENDILFKIQPDGGVDIGFWVKSPGFGFDVRKKNLSFSFSPSDMDKIDNDYERVLYDALRGDQTLFAGFEEVKNSWDFISSIMKGWSGKEPVIYDPGSPIDDIG